MAAPINRLESLWSRSETGEAPIVPEPPLPRRMQRQAKRWERGAEGLMAKHPTAAILAAAAVGLVLGWIVKRK